ncbi:MAG: substrate-binding domain-containing protein [Thermodesulfobacteriota bacterium]
MSGAALTILAAGATEAVIRDVAGAFERNSGLEARLAYAPVGAIRERIFAGEPADLAIVTPAVIEELGARGLVRPDTAVPLGHVGGGIAVRRGAAHPAVETPEAFKAALLAAEEIYHADPRIGTAGATLLRVADGLGIGGEVRRKGRTAGGGKASMERMALSTAVALGVTQISEILAVKEVDLVGPYPGSLQSMTTYAGILLESTLHPEAARSFLAFLLSPPVRDRFVRGGFEPVP